MPSTSVQPVEAEPPLDEPDSWFCFLTQMNGQIMKFFRMYFLDNMSYGTTLVGQIRRR